MKYSPKWLLIICSTKMRLDSGLSGQVAFAIREIAPHRSTLIQDPSKIVDQPEHFMKLLTYSKRYNREENIRRMGMIVIDVWKIDRLSNENFLIFSLFFIEILITKNIFHSKAKAIRYRFKVQTVKEKIRFQIQRNGQQITKNRETSHTKSLWNLFFE